MKIWLPVSIVLSLFWLAYRFYGRRIARFSKLDETIITPAHRHNDGFDYVPTSKSVLLAQHFASIAAAGPIVGPIAAGLTFGWLPTLLWILFGCITIGAVHDFSSLVASVRSDAKSVPELAKGRLGTSAYRCILVFIWLCLVYVIIAFTDVTAQQFIAQDSWGGQTHDIGGGVATSSILYLLLSIALGITTTKGWLSLRTATILFFPALVAIIFYGQEIPIRVPGSNPAQTWSLCILVYCAVASMLPMWLLLQPRGYLGGFFLYTILILGALGLLFGSFDVTYPAFIGFYSKHGSPLFPFLFITVACGACSGFHGLVCSGTTSKQLAKEPHAHLVGYGGMLLEGVVAVIALATVMILAPGDPLLAKTPAEIYATGIARFAHALFSLDPQWGLTFGMLAFATFVYDTLDVATRLGRYLVQEIFEFSGWRGRVWTTILTLILPLAYVLFSPRPEVGAPPLWAAIWPLFGSSNQLLAALTLLLMGLWFSADSKLPLWLLIPGLIMMATSLAALVSQMVVAGRSFWATPTVMLGLNLVLCLALISLALIFSQACLEARRRPSVSPLNPKEST